jgi:hypothetical protein
MLVEPADAAGDPCLLTGATLRGFAVRAVVLGVGGRLAFNEHQWRDSLVEVESGELEIQLRSGRRLLCRTGTLLPLAGLPIRALRNPGRECTSLVSVSRRTPSQ